METIYLPEVIPAEIADYYYLSLLNKIKWEDDRKVYKCDEKTSFTIRETLIEISNCISEPIILKLNEIYKEKNMTLKILGCCLNYYKKFNKIPKIDVVFLSNIYVS